MLQAANMSLSIHLYCGVKLLRQCPCQMRLMQAHNLLHMAVFQSLSLHVSRGGQQINKRVQLQAKSVS